MKIAHLIWSLNVGGAESMLVDLANEQSERHEVFLIVGNAKVNETLLERLARRVRVVRIRRPEGSANPWYLMQLIRALRKIRPDVLHAHNESFARILSWVGRPALLTVHHTGAELGALARRFAAICCISGSVRDDLRARGCDAPLRVVPNGVNCSAVEVKTEYEQRPFRVLQVGRLDHLTKGQDILIRALRRIKELESGACMTADFIGEGASRPLLEALIDELGMVEVCRLLGERPRSFIFQNLRHYDLLVQPSRSEGFGLTIVEAMAARVPVLVSDIEGPMEIIEQGVHGFHFRGGDIEDCGRAILEIAALSGTEAFRHRLLRSAAHARQRFDVNRMASGYISEYSRAMQQVHGSSD